MSKAIDYYVPLNHPRRSYISAIRGGSVRLMRALEILKDDNEQLRAWVIDLLQENSDLLKVIEGAAGTSPKLTAGFVSEGDLCLRCGTPMVSSPQSQGKGARPGKLTAPK